MDFSIPKLLGLLNPLTIINSFGFWRRGIVTTCNPKINYKDNPLNTNVLLRGTLIEKLGCSSSFDHFRVYSEIYHFSFRVWRSIALKSLVVNSSLFSRVTGFCSRVSTNHDKESERLTTSASNSSISMIHLSSLFGDEIPRFDIELVDDVTWHVSAEEIFSKTKEGESESEKQEASKGKSDLKESKTNEASKGKIDFFKESKKEYPSQILGFGGEKLDKVMMSETYGTLPEPLCLNIFILNAFAVRACIVHRVTSKVVAVAHLITKDKKFDLGSTRNTNACAAIGSILSHRALGDDILDVVYTPRKGEKLEGKLQFCFKAYCCDRKRFIAITWRGRINQDNQRQQEVLLLGIAYEYYIDPISHYKFRSKNEVAHFFNCGSKPKRKKTNIDVDMEPLGSSSEQQSSEEKMIEEMISKGLQVNAVHHICELGLVDKFPPVPLLKAFLKNERKAVISIFEDPNNADRAAYLAAQKVRSALWCVIQCIEWWKLEAEFPPENLKKYLEKIETAFNL
ncbi:hypothetical protein QYF36_011406 [Acer negundo]|nr:hypothetical protein QYF36_011406 [Acer negundo]